MHLTIKAVFSVLYSGDISVGEILVNHSLKMYVHIPEYESIVFCILTFNLIKADVKSQNPPNNSIS